MRTMKKCFVLLILICSMTVVSGCGRQPEEPLDVGRYYGKSVDIFLEDYDLTMEDFDDDGVCFYECKKMLPFMNREGKYTLGYDEQGNIISIEILVQEDLDKAEDLYKTALEIGEIYDGIKTAENYFDSFEGEPFRKSTHTYTDKDGVEHEVHGQMNVYSRNADIRNYPAYKELKAAEDLPKGMFGTEVVGIWNLENSVQVRMSYIESSQVGSAGIRMMFYDSTGKLASEFGEANKTK